MNSVLVSNLKTTIPTNKNVIFCATLSLSWRQIYNELDTPLLINDSALNHLNNIANKDFGLNKQEYKASATLEGGKIIANAEFQQSLPFSVSLRKHKNPINFNNNKVESFGLYGSDDEKKLNITKIIYYQNDNHLALLLSPIDSTHEILLFMSPLHFNSLDAMLTELSRLTNLGIEEKNSKELKWKYAWHNDDELHIPKLLFNIEGNYSSLEGSQIIANKQIYTLEKAWQRTAFLLDEQGAKMQSEAELEVAISEPIINKILPKNIIFNKPFYLIIKRKSCTLPYLALQITNAEWMIIAK